MGDYNPRQITQMRWKDAKELEKYLFLTGKFNFETKLLEHVSNDKLYKRIYEELALCSENQTRKGIIIEDIGFGGCYIGEIADDTSMQIISRYGNQADFVDINIANDDELQIIKETKTFLTADEAPKMYRHQMTITDQGNVSVTYIVIASSNTVINTLEKFLEVTKADGDYAGLASYLDNDGNIHSAFIRYSYGNVIVQIENGSVSPMKSVSDVVKPA